MKTSDLRPPHDGPNADPVLYGIAAGLAELFPPVMTRGDFVIDPESRTESERDAESRDGD